MLLDDDVIAQHFHALFCAAEALKQTTIVPQRAPQPVSSYSYLDEAASSASHASFLPRMTTEPPNRLTVGMHDARVLPASRLSSEQTGTTTAAQSVALPDRVDTTCIQKPVQLSRVLEESDVSVLRHIGDVIEAIATQLEASVDAKLVDFYTHLTKKVNNAVVKDNTRTFTAATPTVGVARRTAEQKRDTNPLTETLRPGPKSILHDGTSTSRPAAATTTATTSASAQLLPSVKAMVADASFFDTSDVPLPSLDNAAGPLLLPSSTPSPPRQRAALVVGPVGDLPSPTASFSSTVGDNDSSSFLSRSHHDDSRPSSMPPARGGFCSRTTSSYALPHNAPMAHRMEEERAAAAELQSFFCLLLEAAVRQTDATAAAVYLDDAILHTPNGNNNNDQSFLRTASFIGSTRNLLRTTSTLANATGAAPSNPGRAQFLHCVAHLHGHFPHTISCALTNVLTTVAQTGIAVNLNYSESAAILRPSGLNVSSSPSTKSKTVGTAVTPAAGGAAAKTATNPSLYLNMYNGVVVPIKGVGCLVLANKAKESSAVAGVVPPRFSIFDEHVAWSSALISEAVLQQYDRELLLRATTWAPPCAAALRPFTHTKNTAPAAAAGGSGRSRNNSSNASGSNNNTSLERRRVEHHSGSRRRLPVNKAVTILPDPTTLLDGLQKDEVASLVFNAQNDIFAKRLTIVRTEDRQVGKALPPELRTAASTTTAPSPLATQVMAAVGRSSGGGTAGSSASTSAELSDEDLFLAAAQYITNLESLWRKTIAESNTMHTMVDNYNKEIQQRGEKIVHLESRIRELNAHVVQLERRNKPSRFYSSTVVP